MHRIWVHKEDCWYYSVVDIVKLLTQSVNSSVYWSALKKRNQYDQGFVELLQSIKELPLRGKDGKRKKKQINPQSQNTLFDLEVLGDGKDTDA